MGDKRRCNQVLRVHRGDRYRELKKNSTSSIAKRKASCGLSSPATAAPFKGVRMRVWGKWVTEIRDPVTKARIWLGSFATAEMAARAYDAAVVCLKGASAPEVNFPDSIPSFVVPHCTSSPKEIQAVALAAATASVPAAAALAVAGPELTDPREELEALDVEESATSSDSRHVENWVKSQFEELDALDEVKATVNPPLMSRQFSEFVVDPLISWPMSEENDDAADFPMVHHDLQLWSFA